MNAPPAPPPAAAHPPEASSAPASPARRRRQRAVLLLSALFALLTLAVLYGGWLQTFDARLGDLLLRAEAARRPAPDDIVLIEIDQKSLDDPRMLELAGNWPWPRAVHGELHAFLARETPRTVVYDLIFSEPDVFRPESDALFSEALRAHPAWLPLVVASDGTGSRLADLPPQLGVTAGPAADPEAHVPLIAPKALAVDTWHTGLINYFADTDGVGRRYWLAYPHAGWTLASLPKRIADDQGWPVPATPSLALHWYGTPFTRISYADIYLELQKERPGPLPSLAGKIVIVGAAAPGLADLRPTPFSAATPGPHMLATAIANLQRGDWLRSAPGWASPALALALIALGAVGFLRNWNPLALGGGLMVATAAATGVAWLSLTNSHEWRPYAALACVWAFYLAAAVLSHLQERRQREHAVRMFGRFLDPRVVHTLTGEGEIAAAQAGRSQEISVLFSDIRGFTTLSEKSTPEDIVRLLNRYFDLQVGAIFDTDGTLDKFIGDAIMAFWGAPVPRADHAVRAVEAALAMADRLQQFKAELGEDGAGFDVGIGIHTGPAVVGFLGSSQRLDYTAIGDTVNLASRIEGQTKGIARILVSDATRAACEAQGAPFTFVDHGEFHVKGREQPVRLFEPRRST